MWPKQDTLKDFYEEYWDHRKGIGKIHTEDRAYISERLKAVVLSIAYGDRKINILDVGCEEEPKFVKHLKAKRLRDKFIRRYPQTCSAIKL